MIAGIVDFVLPGSLNLESVELFHKYGNAQCMCYSTVSSCEFCDER